MVMLLPGTQANNKEKTTLNHAKKDNFHFSSLKTKELGDKGKKKKKKKETSSGAPISFVHSTLKKKKKKKLRFDDDFGAKKCSCFEEDRPCPVHSLDEDTLGIDQL